MELLTRNEFAPFEPSMMNEDGGATLMNDNTCVDQQVERRRGMMIPSSSSLVENFADRLAHFLEVDEAVKAIWCEVLQEGVEDFPRHFYTLCSISPATTRMGFLTTAPRPFSLEYCFPLETHFSFFLHTFGHSYLHSSIGTFAGYVETNLRLNPESVSQFSSPLVFQHLFVQLMDIILFSSLEISEQLAETYGEVFSHTQAPSYSQVAFFLKTFFSNFVCGCLEQPQVVLSLPLSPETIGLCTSFSSVLKEIVSFVSQESQILLQQQQQQQQHEQQSPSLSPALRSFLSDSFLHHIQNQLKTFCSFILWEGGGKKDEGETKDVFAKGYREFFLPLWEQHHQPCNKVMKGGIEGEGKKHTCSMKEPSPLESFLFFEELLKSKMGKIREELQKKSPRWNVEVEVMRGLVGWMEENREGVKRELGEKKLEEGMCSPQMESSLFNLDFSNLSISS